MRILRVLVLQVTTTGAISGTLNYQVFPLGVGADQVQISMILMEWELSAEMSLVLLVVVQMLLLVTTTIQRRTTMVLVSK